MIVEHSATETCGHIVVSPLDRASEFWIFFPDSHLSLSFFGLFEIEMNDFTFMIKAFLIMNVN